MKLIPFFVLILSCSYKCQSQVLEYFKSIENQKDTALDLKYFKKINPVLVQKLDSFLLFKKKGEKPVIRDTSYIEIQFFTNLKYGNSIYADIYERKDYCDYTLHFPVKFNKGNIIAFTFYKSKLIVFSMPYNTGKVKKEYISLLKDLIYNEMRQDVKNDIDANVDEVEIIISRSKRYIVEKDP